MQGQPRHVGAFLSAFGVVDAGDGAMAIEDVRTATWRVPGGQTRPVAAQKWPCLRFSGLTGALGEGGG